MVAHTCNPSTLRGLGVWITLGQEFKTSLPGQHGQTPSLLKIEKLAEHGGRRLNPSYSQKAEAGELLEPRRSRDCTIVLQPG